MAPLAGADSHPVAGQYHTYWLKKHPVAAGETDEYQVVLVSRMPIDNLAAQVAALSYLYDQPAHKVPPILVCTALTITTYQQDSV